MEINLRTLQNALVRAGTSVAETCSAERGQIARARLRIMQVAAAARAPD
jgi:hypothetical protein